MPHLDPTYLRTIHDGLLSGTIHKENASALPIGLVGMYEEALPVGANVNERKRFLEFFAVWALLKKEVSAAFVVTLLEDWTEEHVSDYISKYSKWFNSPVSGKYVLYHERLRSFILQKIAHVHFTSCNEYIIQIGNNALQTKSGDEWERYALEHLSTHLLIQAMESKDAAALKTLAYDTVHWSRQVEISKGFEWSKRMLNDMMLWASKFDDDEVIECMLNKVDLHHQEQNDAPRIVELVAQNDIETALQRIEAFGGNDKEGLQRKFILYMLCLMELTLLDSKDKPFRKEAIEKLLKHLDENLPVDHSVLNWDDFFPSYLMFQMACEWADLELGYMNIYTRTNDWEKEWITDKGPYNNLQFKVLNESALSIIRDEASRNRALSDIALELAKQDKFDNACKFASVISDNWGYKSNALKGIAIQMANQGKIDNALEVAKDISDNLDYKSIALKEIAIILVKQDNVEKALKCALAIIDETEMINALGAIATILSKQNELEQSALLMSQAILRARGLRDKAKQFKALTGISSELVRQRELKVSASIIQESFEYASGISDDAEKSIIMEALSTELAEQGNLDQSYDCARHISYKDIKSKALRKIASELAKNGKIKKSVLVMQEAIELYTGQGSQTAKIFSLKDVSTELVKHGRIDQALACALSVSDVFCKDSALAYVAIELIKKSRDAEALDTLGRITSKVTISNTMKEISNELAKLNKIKKAVVIIERLLQYSHDGSDESYKIRILTCIVSELAHIGKLNEAVHCSIGINNESERSFALKDIASDLNKHKKGEEATFVIQEALKCARAIIDESFKSRLLMDIASELAKQYKIVEAELVIQESLEYARKMSYVELKIPMMLYIANELTKLEKLKEATSVLEETLDFANDIVYKMDKNRALKNIVTELARMGRIQKAIEVNENISDESDKSSALATIAMELFKRGNIKDAFEYAYNIGIVKEKVMVLANLSTELVKIGQNKEAESVLREAFEFAKGMRYEFNKIHIALNTFILEQSESAQLYIAIQLTKQDKLNQALVCINDISDGAAKSEALQKISSFLAKQGKFEEAIKCSLDISSKQEKSISLKNISSELVKQENWLLSETTSLEIPQISERNSCWKEIAKNTSEENGWQRALQLVFQLQHEETKTYYLKGVVDFATPVNADKEQILAARNFYMNDIESMEKLLQHHALHELFFSDAPSEKIERFNKTLNIQWAIDIKNSFSAN